MATLDTTPRKVEKRNRPPVSCELCRTRKLKCNRGLPCDTCVRRDKAALCSYAANATRGKAAPKLRDIKDRLNNLENLVSSFVSGEAVIQPGRLTETEPTADIGNTITPSFGQYNSDVKRASTIGSSCGGDDALTPETPHLQETRDGQVNYIDPNHWLSVLDDIKEVREHLSVPTQPILQTTTAFETESAQSDASFLFSSNENPNLGEILSSLPSQPICDLLLSWYFNNRFMVLGMIHPIKFQNEYTAFWESPMTTSPLWIGLLFSVLGVTVSLRKVANIKEPEGSVPPTRILHKRTSQCLLLGKYSTANAHALEAFIFHLQTYYLTRESPNIDPWFEMGTIIRLAFRMGYHRDPRHLVGISPFDGEMRRRVWLNIFQLDALMSFQFGFPSTIPTEYCDTETPRNLEYSDLTVGMTELPPSRPLSEQTPVLYIIVKASVMAVFKKIVAHSQSLSAPTYNQAITLDAEMNLAYNAIPESMKRRDVNRSFLDHSCLIWQRCTIEVLYLKGIIVLHRRYITYEPQNSSFEYARRACIEAALNILARHADLTKACESGGRLYEDRWMMSLLPAHDFLLAAMVACLDLSVRIRARRESRPEVQDSQQIASREYQALQTSQGIWAASSTSSHEAHVAALALDLMIKKVAENDVDLFFVHNFQSMDAAPVDSSELSYAGSMSQMIDGSENIDWALLDLYLHNIDPSVADTVM